jgi:hypothetical protein
MYPQAFLVRQAKSNRDAIAIKHTPTSDPVQPLLAADGAEVFAQAIEHSRP